MKEGNLEAPIRHPLNWQDKGFYDKQDLYTEMERVFDLCHGCRRCVSLCQSFPILFDLVDESSTMEVDGVDKKDYHKVVDQCYLCDLCYMTKCPYVPPHEWNIDFPHLMLRAKAIQFKEEGTSIANKLISSPQTLGNLVTKFGFSSWINYVNKFDFVKKIMGLHHKALLPKYYNQTASRVFKIDKTQSKSKHKVAIFTTCYGEHNNPQIVTDLISVLRHNNVEVILVQKTQCCGMPKLELGDLEGVVKYTNKNKKPLLKMVNKGFTLMAAVPSCVLMFKNELPMMLPKDKDIQTIAKAFVDPFEYLVNLNNQGDLKTDFKDENSEILYHMACHQRVQNIGAKTKEVLNLIPNTELKVSSRCSGHDGTYGIKKNSYEFAIKIGKPITKQITKNTQFIVSDCAIAGEHIANISDQEAQAMHPISFINQKYQEK